MREKIDLALLNLERAGTPAARLEAADALCELAFDATPEERTEFAAIVVRLLADKQDEVRCAGLALAGEVLAPVEAKELLARHLEDRAVRVRVEAAGRLADLALPESRGSLAAALRDPELGVRFEAARGMVALEHAAGFEVLVEALDSVDLRFRAASALAQLGKKEAIEPLKRVFGSWFLPAFDKTQIAGALAALGDADGLAHLFKRAGKRWAMDRAMALELLGEVRAPGAKERLLEVLGAAEDPCRGTAARALGRLGDLTVESQLVRLVDDGSAIDDLRLDAAEGLLLLGTESARAHVAGVKLGDPAAAEELAAMIREYAPTNTP
ncbi:MAG: HEAT repeat domain-containing protein [Myxococcota bacterium]